MERGNSREIPWREQEYYREIEEYIVSHTEEGEQRDKLLSFIAELKPRDRNKIVSDLVTGVEAIKRNNEDISSILGMLDGLRPL